MDFQLTLEQGLWLPKRSYVNIETLHTIPAKFLKRLDYGPRRLTPKSYNELLYYIHFKLPPVPQPPSSRTARPNPRSWRSILFLAFAALLMFLALLGWLLMRERLKEFLS